MKRMNWDKLIPFLKSGGKIITTAESPHDERLDIYAFSLIDCSLEASAIGSFEETKQMFDLVSNNNLKVGVEKSPINPENFASAFKKMDDDETRFRAVMTDFDKYFLKTN
jgi:alcohol dehydrogenase (NADP+)